MTPNESASGVSAFVQARMSSERFPGKVLAPCAGRPIVARVADAVARVVPRERVVLATSTAQTDDPLAAYASAIGLRVFRGDRLDVFERFQQCLRTHPCEWFFRVCADSPLLDTSVMERALKSAQGDIDLITNVAPRTFPRGQSVELLRSDTFAAIGGDTLDAASREHLTRVYYTNPDRFRILNLESDDPEATVRHLAVDTIDDLRRIEMEIDA